MRIKLMGVYIIVQISIYIFQRMDADEEIIRFEVCQKCHEHHKIDPHSELAYQQAFVACKDMLTENGFKVVRNVAYKYLRKAQDTKASSKRYIDQNTQKVQEFPRRGSFEIYYMNILVFSKLQAGEFPQTQLILQIVKRIQKSYRKNPLLESFQLFRDFEIEWKKNQKYLDSVYHYFQLGSSKPDQAELDRVFIKLEKDKISEKDKKKVIYPYSFYAYRQKNSTMERIYCSDFFKKTDKEKSFNHISSKVSAYTKTRPPTSPSKSNFLKKHEQLNNMHSLRSQNLNSIRLKTIDKKQIKKKNDKNCFSSTHPQQTRGSQTRESTAQIKKTNRMLSSLPQSKQNQSTERFFSGKASLQTKNNHSSNQTQRMLKKNGSKLQQRESKKQKQKMSSVRGKGNGKKVEKEKSSEGLKVEMMDEAIKEQVNKIIDNFPLSMINSKEFGKGKGGEADERYSLVDQWASQRISFNDLYECATICSKFSQRQNFNTFLFENEFLNQSSSENLFQIQGFELPHYFSIHTLREIYPPHHLSLFPPTIQPVEGKFLKLVFAVNLLLRKNPLLITRLFENKKFINPYGNYCIWLKHPRGEFGPTIIDDRFAFSRQKDLIYSKILEDNCIWFILLEKAFAKVLGGYHHIDEISLAETLGMMLNCPNVQFKNLNPQKLMKVLNERIFYNRLAFLYSIPVDSLAIENKEVEEVRRVVGVDDQNEQEKSIVLEHKHQNKETMRIKKFLVEYNSISLIFFNSNFMMNQVTLPNCFLASLLSCQLKSKHSNNDCYLVFNNFPSETFTKVSIFKKLSDENFSDQLHVLQEEKRYKYIGEIVKKENFFFQTQLQSGEYICLLQAKFEDQENLHLAVYSEKQISISDIKLHSGGMSRNKSDEFYMKESKVSTKEKKKGRNEQVSTVLVERSLHKMEKDSKWGKSKRSSDFRIRKKFMAMDDEEEGLSEKEN